MNFIQLTHDVHDKQSSVRVFYCFSRFYLYIFEQNRTSEKSVSTIYAVGGSQIFSENQLVPPRGRWVPYNFLRKSVSTIQGVGGSNSIFSENQLVPSRGWVGPSGNSRNYT